jgi:hypothetical protein
MTRAFYKMIAQKNDFDVSDESLAELAKVPNDQHAEVHAEFGLSPTIIDEITKVLLSHVWRVLISSNEEPFFTSDNPLAFHCHVPRPGRGTGIGTYGVEVAFPLSPTLTLCLVHREFAREHLGDWEALEGTTGESTPANVEYYRWMQIVSSRRFVFAPTDDFSFVTTVCRDQPEISEMNRQRMEVWVGGEQV